jgi:2,3-bisphosphoglycerate-independent phosphoglycerate mutase
MSTLLVLLDGAVDHPNPELDGLTPLQAADLSFIDSLKGAGTTDGRGYTHLFLLELLTGERVDVPRGLIEAIGLGMNVAPGRMACRFSPAIVRDGTVEWEYHVTAEMATDLSHKVLDSLRMLDTYHPEVRFYESGRGVLVMDEMELGELPRPPTPGSIAMANLNGMRDFVATVSEATGGMTVLPWGGGGMPIAQGRAIAEICPLTVVSNSPSALGVGGLIGAEMVLVEDIPSRALEAHDRLTNGNVLLHFEEIDEASHRRDPGGKVTLLEQADALLAELFADHDDILVLVDHGTSCLTGEHMAVPVPFLCSKGGRGHILLDRLIRTLLG